MTTLVSVVIPAYNRAYCLQRTLDSVLAQTHENLEIVLVDDGSTDETRELVSRCYGSDQRVRYIYQQNHGVAGARNQGLAMSRGDYIALLDSDDYWMPWKVEQQLACFRQCPELGMVWTDMEAIGPDGRVISSAYLRTMYHAYRWFSKASLFSRSFPQPLPALGPKLAGARFYCGDIFSAMIMGSLVHTSTVMLSRERLEKVGEFNKDLQPVGEDYDFFLRTCREGPVGFFDVASIRYQTGMPDQLTNKAYRVPVALSCLATVLPVLHHDRDRIRLPRSMIRARLAEIYQWAGDALLESGQSKRARQHLFKALWYGPLDTRTMALLIRAALPRGAGNLLQRCWRWLKKGVSPKLETRVS